MRKYLPPKPKDSVNSTKKSVLEPFDESSFVRVRCYLYEGYYSPLMATPIQQVAYALGVETINIVLPKN